MIVDELLIAFKTDGADKAAKSVEKVDDKLAKAKEQLKKYEEAAKKTGRAQDKLAVESSRKLVRALEKQQREFKRTEMRAKMFRAALTGAGKGISALSSAATRGGVVAIGTAFTAAAASVNKLAQDADQIKNSAASLGLTTDAYQRLTFAAEKNGLATEQLEGGIKALSARIREASMEGAAASMLQPFDEMQLSVAELAKLDPEQQLHKIADAAQRMGQSARRNATMARILGEEAGPKFAELLNDGSGALDDLAQMAERYGVILSTEVLEKSDEVAEAQTELKAAVRGLSYEVGRELLPIAKDLVIQLREWVVENRSLVASGAKEFVETFLPILRDFLAALTPVVEMAGQAAIAFGELDPTAQKAIVGITALTMAFNGLGGSVTGAVAGMKGLIPLIKRVGVKGGAVGIVGAGAIAATYEAASNAYGYVTTSRGLRSNKKTGLAVQDALDGAGVTRQQIDTMDPQDLADFLKVVPKALAAQSKSVAKLEESLAGNGLGVFERVSAKSNLTGTRERARNIQQARAMAEDRLRALQLDGVYGPDLPEGGMPDAAADAPFVSNIKPAKKKPAGKKSKASDMQIAQLIKEAGQQGKNLDELLANRKMSGGTPPTVLVTVNNNSTNVEMGDLVVKSNATNGTEVARAAAGELKTMFEKMVQQNAKRGARQGA